MKRTAFQEKIHELLELPDGIPLKLELWNDDGDKELYDSFVLIDRKKFTEITDGYNRSALSRALGMNNNYIGSIRVGAVRSIPFETAEAIADLVDASVFELGELVDGMVRKPDKKGGLRKGPKPTKVQCIETGVVFESAVEAGRSVGLESGVCIRQCCRGLIEKSGGYHWRYYEQ